MDDCLGAHMCPECASGKHGNCRGDAWCIVDDAETDCSCHLAGHPASSDSGAS